MNVQIGNYFRGRQMKRRKVAGSSQSKRSVNNKRVDERTCFSEQLWLKLFDEDSDRRARRIKLLLKLVRR
ncbi:MAG: hypothetical protein ABI847_21615, partial [Anaerolineales bacterium]